MIRNAPEWCRCGAVVRDEGGRWICEGCLYVIGGCVCTGGAKPVRKDGLPQHQDEPVSVTYNVRELVRDNTIASEAHYEETRDLLESLGKIIRDQETEICRLSEEQIKPLADYFTSIGLIPMERETACEMALREIENAYKWTKGS